LWEFLSFTAMDVIGRVFECTDAFFIRLMWE